MANVVSNTVESIAVVSKHSKDILKSDSDKILNSLKQLSEIARCGNLSESVVTVTQAVTLGVLRVINRKQRVMGMVEFLVLQALHTRLWISFFTRPWTGFASVVVENFARICY